MQKALKEFNRQYFNEPFNRQTPGWYDDLNSLTIEEVKNAYKATLCPGNSLLVVAGT